MKKPIAVTLFLLLAAGGGGAAYHQWQTVWRWQESTDDAYLASDVTALTAKVGGHVIALDVVDHQLVHKGDILVRIDPRDYQVRREQARALVAARTATLANLDARQAQQRASIHAAEAQIGSAKAELVRSQADLKRSQTLVRDDFVSRQRLDTTLADAHKAEASVQATGAGAEAQRRQLLVLESERALDQAQLEDAQAQLAAAELDLEHTIIRAPADGLVGNRAVQVGTLLRPGSALLTLVPIDKVWVTANFKETQIGAMQPGQKVDLTIDSFPGAQFTGQIDSLAPASGAVFSLLPPDNATGNFTKVVQRIPVKIVIDPSHPLAARLRPGMSAVVTVRTREIRP